MKSLFAVAKGFGVISCLRTSFKKLILLSFVLLSTNVFAMEGFDLLSLGRASQDDDAWANWDGNPKHFPAEERTVCDFTLTDQPVFEPQGKSGRRFFAYNQVNAGFFTRLKGVSFEDFNRVLEIQLIRYHNSGFIINPNDQETLKLFKEPSVSLFDWVTRINSYNQIENIKFKKQELQVPTIAYKYLSIITLNYFKRVHQMYPNLHFSLNYNIKRLFLVFYILASQYFEDSSYEIKDWNIVGFNFYNKEDGKALARMLREFMFVLKFDFNVKPEEFNVQLGEFLAEYDIFKQMTAESSPDLSISSLSLSSSSTGTR